MFLRDWKEIRSYSSARDGRMNAELVVGVRGGNFYPPHPTKGFHIVSGSERE
jgi:hypothetical protein